MFPIHFKLTVTTLAQLECLTAFLGSNAASVLAAVNPKIETSTVTVEQAPGKPAATPAPSPRTAKAVVAAAPAASTETQAATPSTTPATQPATAAATSVAYPDLQKAVLTLHKLDPSAAIPIAKSLGADTFKVLPEEKWAEALRLVVAKTDELKAA